MSPSNGRPLVSFAGFPGAWRQPPVGNHVDFDTFAIGAQPVTSSYSDRLAFQFERGYWVSSYGVRGRAFSELGGLSGGPVMVMRQLHWEMAGFITHFSKEWDILFATPSARVRADGRLDTE